MGLIGKAWTDRLDMFRWLTDEAVAACDDAAVLGVGDCDLGDLPRQLAANKADTPAPLVQAVSYLEGEYLETFLLTPPERLRGAPEGPPASCRFGRPRLARACLWRPRWLLLAAQSFRRLLRADAVG